MFAREGNRCSFGLIFLTWIIMVKENIDANVQAFSNIGEELSLPQIMVWKYLMKIESKINNYSEFTF